MTEQEINIAIAEACGWNKVPDACYIDGVAWEFAGKRFATCDIPDYCSDLNAMHEARLSLNSLQQNQFSYELMRVLGINSDQIVEACVLFEFANAIARQRAEAFLRTLGKWRDS